MSYLELIAFAFASWAILELVRRSAIAAWREHQREAFGQTVKQYQAYRRDLRR